MGGFVSKRDFLKSWRIYAGILGTLLVVLQTAMPGVHQVVRAAHLHAISGGCGIEVSYTGMDNTHVIYDATGCSEMVGATSVSLMATINSSTTVSLASTGSGTYHHTGLPLYANVSYFFRFNKMGSPVDVGPFLYSSTTTGTLKGTLLFDENVNYSEVASGQWVIIPDGLSMTLDGGSFLASDTVAEFEVQQGGTLNINNIKSAITYFKSPETIQNSLTVTNSAFTGLVSLSGAGRFTGNTFYRDLAIAYPAEIDVENNIFIGKIAIPSWVATADHLEVKDNSFIGYGAFSYDSTHPLAIGSNYYGDKGGLVHTPGVFLETRGAHYIGTSYSYLTVEAAKPSGSYPDPDKLLRFPDIFGLGYIIGQNVLAHNTTEMTTGRMVLGRETLVSIDVGVSVKTMTGLTAYANFDGQKLPPVQIGPIHRDLVDYSSNDVVEGKTTINLILPPTTNQTPILEVILDTHGVSGPADGRPADDKITLLNETLAFQTPQSYSIEVIPIELGGTCAARTAQAGAVVQALRDELPAMFPVSSKNLTVYQMPTYHFKCWIGAALSTNVFGAEVLAELALLTAASRSTFDRTVGVFPTGSLGVGQGTDGINAWYSRGTLAVDELRSFAVFHELGHSYGLYTGWRNEEYQLYPELGLPFQNATAFAPEGWVAANGLHGQFLHAPLLQEGQDPYIWDIMGIPDQVWPIPSTFDKVRLDSAMVAPAEAYTNQTVVSQATDPREMFFWGLMQGDSLGYYHFIPGSFQVFDITGLEASRWDTSTCTSKIPGDPMLTYNLNVLNSQGSMILNLWTDSADPDPTLPNIMPFCTVYQIPQAILDRAASYQLIEGLDGPSVMAQARAAQMDSLTVHPADGSTLGSQIHLNWTNGSGSVMHWVWFSEDGGATWQPAGLPTTDSSLTYDTGFLPAGNNISIQTISSDGFQQVAETISGLTMPNHAPVVQILFPTDGIQAPQTASWDLHGSAWDVEDGAMTGSWSSSLDGSLGSGNDLWGVTLSTGTHVITYSAMDGDGTTSSQHITVQVGPVTSVDLALGQDSLTLLSGTNDPSNPPMTTLLPGANNTLEVSVPGTGIPVPATLSIYVTAPGAGETLLLTQSRTIQPFSTGTWQGTFVPHSAGVYHVRAIVASTLPDPNSGNNEHSWTFTILNKIYLPLVIR
jgi:hypothetical protein